MNEIRMTKQGRTFGYWSLICHSSSRRGPEVPTGLFEFVIRHFWPAGVLGAFALALLLPYTVSGFLLTGDVRDLYLPLEDFYRHELRAGRLPLWSPDMALGFPALASAQIGFLYPPLFVLRFLPPERAVAIAMLAHLAALALGVYAYGRSLGHSRPGALVSAVAFAGSGFVVGHLVHANILFGITWLPWALLLTDRLARNLRPRTGVLLSLVLALTALPGHFHILAVSVGLCLARFLVLSWARFRRAQHTLWVTSLAFGPILAAVVLLIAAQLFPTLELLRESSRGADSGFDINRANQHSFPPWQAITFAIPAFFGFPDLSEYWGKRPQIEMTAWIGTLPLLLAVVAAFSGRHPEPEAKDPPHAVGSFVGRPRRLARDDMTFWTLTALFGFALALGRWSPFRLIGIEPTLGIFSAPARYLLLTQFALAILAGRGFDRLTGKTGWPPWPPRPTGPLELMGPRGPIGRIGLLAMLAALLIASSFFLVQARPDALRTLGTAAADRWILGKPGHVLPREAYVAKIDFLVERLGTWGVNLGNPLVSLSVVLLATGGVTLLFMSRKSATSIGSSLKGERIVDVGFVAAAVLELTLLAWQVHPRVAWTETTRTPPVVAALHDRPPGRLYVVHPPGDTGLLFANRTTTDRAEHETLLRDIAVANTFTRHGISGIEWPAALDLAAASEVLARARDDLGRPRDADLFDRLAVRYVAASTATPNLRLAPARPLTTFPSGESRAITVWERTSPRPRAELFAVRPGEITAPLPKTAGTARITEETPQRIAVAVDNTLGNEATLVLRDTFYQGWQAAVDGAPVRIERADTLFRGVRVPPGEHIITFAYRPLAAYLGMGISAASWTLALVALVHSRRPRNGS